MKSQDQSPGKCLTGSELGYQTFVLQSGEDDFYTDDLLEEIIRA